MKSSLLEAKPNELLNVFLNSYNDIFTIDIEKSRELISIGRKLYNDAPYQKYLVKNWYESLKTSQPAFHLYDDDNYFIDLWICWAEYSRNYLRSIYKNNSLTKDTSILSILKNINTIVDLGCGLGLTTASLKQIFPQSKVYGTNLKSTKQYKFCEFFSKEYNFSIVEGIEDLPQIDFLFASEYFEHIYDCLDEISKCVKLLKPKYLYIANSFNTVSYGHFQFYKDLNCCGVVDQKDISKKFNKTLKELGYRKIKTNLWNNKPTLWMRNES